MSTIFGEVRREVANTLYEQEKTLFRGETRV